MRLLLLFLIYGTFMSRVSSRPQTIEENEESDADERDYEDSTGAVAEMNREEDNLRTNRVDRNSNNQEEIEQPLREFNGKSYFRSPIGDTSSKVKKTEKLPNNMINRATGVEDNQETDDTVDADSFQPIQRSRQSVRYMENNEGNDQQESEQLTNENNYRSNAREDSPRVNEEKHAGGYHPTSNYEGELLFENNKDKPERVGKSQYVNDAESSDQSQFVKSSLLSSGVKGFHLDRKNNNPLSSNRERREASTTYEKDADKTSEKDNSDENTKEDEEAAIKRHIKKLSSCELEELLNTLSDDKRALLKKIMDSDTGSILDSIDKREITKKAGAVEENNFMDNSLSDLSKLQGGASDNPDTEVSSHQSSDSTEANKQTDSQTESSVVTTVKASETSSNADNVDSKIDLSANDKAEIQTNMSGNLNSYVPDDNANIQELESLLNPKFYNKREITQNNASENEYASNEEQTEFNEDSNYGSKFGQNDDLSQFSNYGAELERKTLKRETRFDSQNNLSDPMKSLEESFPNSNTYDESGSYLASEMAPLVRVKRKNIDGTFKKRSASFLPDSLSYAPYKAENEDDDNNEGNEFGESGFYDHSKDVANLNLDLKENLTSDETEPLQKARKIKSLISKSNSVSLGSDTDNVLSGVEGVDDNLMLSSGARKRRALTDTEEKIRGSDTFDHNRAVRSTPVIEDEKLTSDNYLNAQGYQESEAFGSLPRSYEGELNRFKRIRRLKHSQSLDSSRK